MNNELALVTGAGKRVGQGIAIHLAKIGYDVVIHYSSSSDGAEETKNKINQLGRKAYLMQADLAEVYSAQELVSEVASIGGNLSVLINSASTFPDPDKFQSRHSLPEENEEEWEEALAVNTRAPFFLIKYGAKLLEKASAGTVINILDESVITPALSRASHTISKKALLAVTELAAETYQGGFKVCALVLGNVLPGEKMSQREIASINWIGIQPVTLEVERIISVGENGKVYRIANDKLSRPSLETESQ